MKNGMRLRGVVWLTGRNAAWESERANPAAGSVHPVAEGVPAGITVNVEAQEPKIDAAPAGFAATDMVIGA
jgi:hypothetical protein